MQGFEWPSDLFNGSEAGDDILEGYILVGSRADGCLAHGGNANLVN
jgi:hypothetical protein